MARRHHKKQGLPREGGPFLRVEGRRLPDRKHSLAAKHLGRHMGAIAKGRETARVVHGSGRGQIIQQLLRRIFKLLYYLSTSRT